MRLLKVKGIGEVYQTPDLIVVSFELVSKDYDYDKAMKELNEKTVILRQDVVKAGFSKDDLKTTNFSINTDYKYQNGQKIFLGYIGTHQMKLAFDYDMAVLNRLMRIISNSTADPNFTITFEVKDKRAFKDAILMDAVNNAKQNASVIAKASNIRLGRIFEIRYDDAQPIVYQSNLSLQKEMVATASLDIVPEEIKGTETVFMQYEIDEEV